MLLNAIILAFREIRRNVLRSSLTTLGIIIGVASVIMLVTLGNSATQSVTASIASKPGSSAPDKARSGAASTVRSRAAARRGG